MAKVPDDGRVTEKLKIHNIIIIITVIVTLQHSCATTEVQFRIKKGGRGGRRGEEGRGGERKQSRTIYLTNRDWNCAAVILMII
jgi:hypothetical protein